MIDHGPAQRLDFGAFVLVRRRWWHRLFEPRGFWLPIARVKVTVVVGLKRGGKVVAIIDGEQSLTVRDYAVEQE